MRERWDEAINKIDEKYIAEAAQTHAKHTAKQLEAEQFEAESERPTSATTVQQKKSSKGRIFGICAAAAAVAVIAIGGGVMMSRDDSILTGDTTNEVTSEATAESSETVEYIENGELAIGFSQNYNEGYIRFEQPEKAAWLGLNGVTGSMSDWSYDEVFTYIEEMKNIDLAEVDFRQAHENLERNGYKLDLSQGASYMNALATDDDYNHQITLRYNKADAQIMINIGQSGVNFNYHSLGDSGYRLKTNPPGGSYLRVMSGQDYTPVNVSGMMLQGGDSYYAASLTSLWGNWIYCDISARNCSIEELTDVFAGIVCGKETLTEKEFTHLELDNYSGVMSARYNTSMVIDGYMYEELAETVSGFATADPVYDIARDEASSAVLRLYIGSDYEGHYDYLRLHKTVERPLYPEYYYSLSDGNSTAYFEITKESYEAMDAWFAEYAPTYIEAKVIAEDDIGNRTDAANGSYMVQDSNGEVYSVNVDEVFAVGDTLRIWFYGGVMESYPAQLNEIKAEKIYDIASDDKTLVSEDMELGYDPDIYEEYFLGEWKECFGASANYDWSMTFDYNSGFADHLSCGELADGYYLAYNNGGELYFFFIPKEFTDSMYAYYGMDIRTHKRCDYAAQYTLYAEIGNTLSGALNYFGRQELCDIMGGNFSEVFNSLYEDITDNDGRVWCFDQGKGGINDTKPHLKNYYQDGFGQLAYAEIFMEYADVESYDYMASDYDAVTQWYSHFIQLKENGYELIATLPCDSKGNVYPDSEYKSFSEDDLYGHVVTAVFSWAGSNDYIVYPQVYVEDTNTRKVLAQTELVNPAMYTHGGSVLGGTSIIVQDVPLESGAAFAVLVPFGYDEEAGEIRYYATFYSYDRINKEISLLGEEGLFRECVNADITTDRENNLVKILTPDHALEVYHIDLRSNTVELVESGNENGTFTVDFSKGGTGRQSAAYGLAFGCEWTCGSEVLRLDLESDMFSYSDPCSFYTDDSGFFMLAEGRVWYVPRNDMDIMYYYEGVEDKAELAFKDADKVYNHSGEIQGYYGEGEKGWFGLLSFLYTEDDRGVTVDELFNMEITDENGNVWVRTPDRSIDWGGFYQGRVNGDTVYFLKMQSKNHPDVFQYFSFNFNTVKMRAGELSYTDEHYSFSMDVFDTSKLATDYAAEAKADSDSIGFGVFMVETEFFTLDNGGYYAVRMMGNNGAQWLSYGEVFYNARDFDGAEGYEKICETNVCDCVTDGELFYRLYNRYDAEGNTELWFAMYDGTELIYDVKENDEGFVAMDAHMELIGTEEKYILVSYYDTVNSVDRYALYETGLSPNYVPAARTDEVIYNSDGSVTLKVTGGAVINIT